MSAFTVGSLFIETDDRPDKTVLSISSDAAAATSGDSGADDLDQA
jgi:hypothetical protein